MKRKGKKRERKRKGKGKEKEKGRKKRKEKKRKFVGFHYSMSQRLSFSTHISSSHVNLLAKHPDHLDTTPRNTSLLAR